MTHLESPQRQVKSRQQRRCCSRVRDTADALLQHLQAQAQWLRRHPSWPSRNFHGHQLVLASGEVPTTVREGAARACLPVRRYRTAMARLLAEGRLAARPVGQGDHPSRRYTVLTVPPPSVAAAAAVEAKATQGRTAKPTQGTQADTSPLCVVPSTCSVEETDKLSPLTDTFREREGKKDKKKEIQPSAGTAGPSPSESPRGRLWREIAASIGGETSKARRVVGLWCKTYGEEAVWRTHKAVLAEEPADYASRMWGCLRQTTRPYRPATGPGPGRAHRPGHVERHMAKFGESKYAGNTYSLTGLGHVERKRALYGDDFYEPEAQADHEIVVEVATLYDSRPQLLAP